MPSIVEHPGLSTRLYFTRLIESITLIINHVTSKEIVFFFFLSSGQDSLMGKSQKKTGKGRLDKYYKLAKYVSYILDHLAIESIPSTGSKAIVLVPPSNSSS